MTIDFLSPEDEINPDDDNVDVILRLDDGRSLLLLVATPNNIYRSMDNESTDYYFGVPPMFVKKITRLMVEAAVTALLESPEWLSVYGTLQD
jgi:hypothetical protein